MFSICSSEWPGCFPSRLTFRAKPFALSFFLTLEAVRSAMPLGRTIEQAEEYAKDINSWSGSRAALAYHSRLQPRPKPELLLLRAQAYKLARQTARAAKDYQTIFYKFPLSDEAKVAAGALPQLIRSLSKEYPYPGVELQEQRAQAFFDAHKWKEARAEFDKLLTMLRDPANPHRQLAQFFDHRQ